MTVAVSRINSLRACITLCVLVQCATAVGDEIKVYESLTDVEIGRIFLTPEQRASLDNRRGEVPAMAPQEGSDSKAPRKKHSADAAGYIVSSSGKSRVWSNGDFVVADEVSEMIFPGDVQIVRQAAESSIDEPGIADDGT